MRRPIRLLLASTPLILMGAAAWRSASSPTMELGQLSADKRPLSPSEQAAPPPLLRVMTLNLAHGRGLAQHQSLLRRSQFGANLVASGQIIAREAPDVVALQEADGPSVWSGHFDHVQSLANYSDYPHQFRGTHAQLGAEER
jgi:hypothetical protein